MNVFAPTTAPPSTALAVEIFGRRMHDQIGAQIKRTLQDRRAEAIVDGDEDVPRMCDVAQRPDIRDFGQRIGRRLQEEELRIRPGSRHPTPPCRSGDTQVVVIPKRDRMLLSICSVAPNRLLEATMVTDREVGHDQREDRRHATTGRCHRRLGAFERGEALLEGIHRRIGEAR